MEVVIIVIGLKIKIKNEYRNYLEKIFSPVHLLQYKWEILTDDILYRENGQLEQGLFEIGFLDGDSFKKAISRENHYLIFVDIRAYPCNANIANIQTFEDFMKSECQILFMCWDSSYVNIYCKDKKILEALYSNCNKFSCEPVSYISMEQAKGRTLVAF